MAGESSIDELVASADPLRDPYLDDEAVEAALDALGVRITASAGVIPRARQKRAWAAVAAATLVVGLVAGVPAAANWVAARTGSFGNPALTEEDGSEWLRLDSSEMPSVIAEKLRALDLALPPGTTSDEVVAAVISKLPPPDAARGPGRMQETGVRNVIAWDVGCRWGRTWLAASGPDEQAVANEARRNLTEVASRSEVLAAALGTDDAWLAQMIKANCQ